MNLVYKKELQIKRDSLLNWILGFAVGTNFIIYINEVIFKVISDLSDADEPITLARSLLGWSKDWKMLFNLRLGIFVGGVVCGIAVWKYEQYSNRKHNS